MLDSRIPNSLCSHTAFMAIDCLGSGKRTFFDVFVFFMLNATAFFYRFKHSFPLCVLSISMPHTRAPTFMKRMRKFGENIFGIGAGEKKKTNRKAHTDTRRTMMMHSMWRWVYEIMDQPMILSSIITKLIRIYKQRCLNQLKTFDTGRSRFLWRICTVCV